MTREIEWKLLTKFNKEQEIMREHEMEKILYAVDELTGLIGAVALMRPPKSNFVNIT